MMLQRWACVNWMLRNCKDKQFNELEAGVKKMLSYPKAEKDEQILVRLKEIIAERDNLKQLLEGSKEENLVLTLVNKIVVTEKQKTDEEL